MEQVGRVEGLVPSLASPKAAFAGRDAEHGHDVLRPGGAHVSAEFVAT
ncbi:hypothetical protein [Salinifilum ghardaiensis]